MPSSSIGPGDAALAAPRLERLHVAHEAREARGVAGASKSIATAATVPSPVDVARHAPRAPRSSRGVGVHEGEAHGLPDREVAAVDGEQHAALGEVARAPVEGDAGSVSSCAGTRARPRRRRAPAALLAGAVLELGIRPAVGSKASSRAEGSTGSALAAGRRHVALEAVAQIRGRRAGTASPRRRPPRRRARSDTQWTTSASSSAVDAREGRAPPPPPPPRAARSAPGSG